MDWTFKNNFAKWVIVILLIVNIITVSIIWIQTTRTNRFPPPSMQGDKNGPAGLMQHELGLSDEQVKQYNQIRKENLDEAKAITDKIADTKIQFAKELFKQNPDTVVISSLANQIGKAQSQLEVLRFYQFRRLIAICKPEQKEKLKPIIEEVLGSRQPPERNDERGEGPGGRGGSPGRPGDGDHKPPLKPGE